MASLPLRSKSPIPKLKNPFSSQPDATVEKTQTEVNANKEGAHLTFGPPPLTRNDSKRSSISFSIPATKPMEPKEQNEPKEVEPELPRVKLLRRASSPPPQRTYSRGVSFDTFDNRDATEFSFTLNYKHKNYAHTRRSRTFLCGTDQKDYSEFALEWLIDELVDDGDEIVCLRVVEKDSKLVNEASIDKTKYRQEAEKLLNQVIAKNTQEDKAISLVMELAVGKVQDIIQRMIQIYEPAVLIVGTRGRSLNGMQGLLPGSVSKYCLQQSPIPVIVVRPSNKRMKKKKKRLADPTRRDYSQILSMSEAVGGHLLDRPVRESINVPLPTATEQEAAAVARAIGLPKTKNRYDGAPLTKTMSARSDMTSDAESPSPTAPMSPETRAVVLKSPTLEPINSPQLSSESEEEDIVDRYSKRKPSKQAGKAVGAVVDEVVPQHHHHHHKKPKEKPPPSPLVYNPNDAGQNILDILDELTG